MTEMMNLKNIFPALVLTAAVTAACDERHPDYFDEIDAVYFNNRGTGNVLTDTTDVTFVYEPLEETRMEVPVSVQLLGRAADFDRSVDISVSSDNAEEGTDYILPEQALIPAGEYSFTYTVTLLRTEGLKSAEKDITLELHANEYFSLALTDMVQTADTATVIRHCIVFSDMFTSAPAAWEENVLGEFSQAKFNLICKVLEIDPDDFNDSAVMTLPRQMFILEEIRNYIEKESEKMDSGDYDKDIIDPDTGNPIEF